MSAPAVEKQAETGGGRDRGGRFVAGVSRPAGPGRPKALPHIQSYAKRFGREAVDVLRDIMLDKFEKGSTRVAAASELLNRGFGRAAVQIDLDVEVSDRRTVAEVIRSIASEAAEGTVIDGEALQADLLEDA